MFTKLPEDFEYYDGEDIMSNFDNIIVEETAKAIKGKKLYSSYPGWNFCGDVWYQDNQWHCDVWCYGSCNDSVSADTLEELKEKICKRNGDK